MSDLGTSERRKVQVWFGTHPIATYVAEPDLAQRYEQAMRRRFAGLRVTNVAVPLPSPDLRPLPSELLWPITPH